MKSKRSSKDVKKQFPCNAISCAFDVQWYPLALTAREGITEHRRRGTGGSLMGADEMSISGAQ